jgi:hypothetical protein
MLLLLRAGAGVGGGGGAGAGAIGTRRCCSYNQTLLSDCSGVAVIAFILLKNAASSGSSAVLFGVASTAP